VPRRSDCGRSSYWNGAARTFKKSGPFELELTPSRVRPTFWSTGGEFLLWGVHHIVIGYDHIAFLLGARKLGELIRVVTAFPPPSPNPSSPRPSSTSPPKTNSSRTADIAGSSPSPSASSLASASRSSFPSSPSISASSSARSPSFSSPGSAKPPMPPRPLGLRADPAAGIGLARGSGVSAGLHALPARIRIEILPTPAGASGGRPSGGGQKPKPGSMPKPERPRA
jgi:hypothetical protein